MSDKEIRNHSAKVDAVPNDGRFDGLNDDPRDPADAKVRAMAANREVAKNMKDADAESPLDKFERVWDASR